MLEIRLLGQFNLRLNRHPINLPSRPAQSLLAYLALKPGTAYGPSGSPDCCGPMPPRPMRAVICGRPCGAFAKRWKPHSAITSSPTI